MKCEEVLFLLSTMFIVSHGEDGTCSSAAKSTVEGHLKYTIRSLWQTEILPEQTKDMKAFFSKELDERDVKISSIEGQLATKATKISSIEGLLNKKDAQISSIKQELAQKDTKISRIEGQLAKQVKNIEGELDKKDTQISGIKRELAQKDKKIDLLTNSIDKLTSQLQVRILNYLKTSI